MGDVVNLNDRRKQKARAEKMAKASANRAKFGRTKSDRQRDALEASNEERRLDGAKRGSEDKSID